MAVLEKKIDSFIGKLELGFSFFQEAGDCLVKLIDEDPQVFDRILEHRKSPWLTRHVLQTIEAIGRGEISPEVLLLPKAVFDRMVNLSVDQQIALLSAPIPVAMGTLAGQPVTDFKPLRELSMTEAARVIGPNGARSIKEQLNFMRRPPRKVIGRWIVQIMNGKPFLKQHSGITKPDFNIILKDGKAVLEFKE